MYAFADCHNLINITIPSSITLISNYAFENCKHLKNVIIKGKTIDEVKAMKGYPFGIGDESIIKCE